MLLPFWIPPCCFFWATGLVAKVYPPEELVDEAVAMAAKIASMSMPVALMCKEAVNAAFEGTLAEGVRLERRMFHSTFALVSAVAGQGSREPGGTMVVLAGQLGAFV